MTGEGTFRSVVLPTLVTTVLMVAFAYFLFQALAETRFAEYVHGGYGGVGAGVGVGIMTTLATRKARRRTKDLLPSALTGAQRDQVMVAARSGPLPADPVVRVEARRLAEQWAAARGTSKQATGLVFAGLAAGCAVAGAVSSPWWWGESALLAGLAGLLLRRDRTWTRHLHDLRSHVDLPSPPTHGVHRLVEDEPLRGLASSDRAVLELQIRKPWGGGTNASSTMVRVNGQLVPSEWGANRYLVPAGAIRVSVWIEYLTDHGRASTTITVSPGDRTVLHYSPPALTLLDGRIGTERQRRPGALGLGIFFLAFVALLAFLIVLFP
ncbi:hypothetical protein SAMN04488544_2473 [Microlunatus sagamiharensis]|uniref:Uncharacterized protein n=1 Tax=Microlunatus sagamiharensis TaxID=546874 RepID=A0A1H2MQ74_9ACTN|nr:hypothetical protein [Microlunatus sagamiharensis]SDU95148.1 hypothetical protein SAMN04488544_2473 [Microlunatus sagamiharensis]